ncbi:proline-, glutamic acid- and leucine-rich protein 1-like isoform X2 [Osmerus eperlanus]|uniref:proline-, glutamic acid- and leucine-rich protein 1-like isoform X2 n=1 Tax=Osmerus eperlanus TaxID=29151 RepID=UPI002E11D63E
MSIHQQYLETIQECEEDEAEKGEDEREEEDEAEDQREEEKGESEEEQLKVMRPGRLSISLVLDDTLTQERITDHSDPGPTTPRTPEDFCVNVSPPRAPRSGLERACCEGSEADGGIKVKFFRNMRRKPTSATRRRLSLSSLEETPRRPGKTRRGQRKGGDPDPLPQWLVNLMYNIEEATTHQLVVE